MMKKYILFLALLGHACLATGQAYQPAIEAEDLKHIIHILASDSFGGRGFGEVGQKKAAEFISERFRAMGLTPYLGDSYLQPFTSYQSAWEEVYLTVAGTRLNNFDEIVLRGSRAENEEVEKTVVFGGTGTDEELDQIDIEGRIVLVFIDNLRNDMDIQRRLAERGAYAVMLANPSGDAQFESLKRTYKSHTLAPRYWMPDGDLAEDLAEAAGDAGIILDHKTNILLLSNAGIKKILGIPARKLYRMALNKQISEVPVKTARVKFERSTQEVEIANVIGRLDGTSDTCLIISAHYDHLGRSDKTYYAGADDNASGVAAMLELADYFRVKDSLPYTIIFLAPTAEETGMLGSKFFTKQPGFDPKKVICNINLDMLGRKDEEHTSWRYLYCLGVEKAPHLAPLISSADNAYSKCRLDYRYDRMPATRLYTRSDQYTFYQQGIPALFFFSGFHEDYHKPSDRPNKINYKHLAYRLTLIRNIISRLQMGNFQP